MTVPAFFGYLFLSCGPPLAAGLPFFWHRSFLSLTVVTSMFAWLALLILTSALFRAFVPLDDTAVGYIPLLLVPVIIEECARIGFWYMHEIAGKHLKQLADTASVRYSPLDELALSYSVGWGHAATHMLFQFGPFLPLTWNSATVYSSRCTTLSIFMVSVLTQLGMFGILAGVLPLVQRFPMKSWCSRCCLLGRSRRVRHSVLYEPVLLCIRRLLFGPGFRWFCVVHLWTSSKDSGAECCM